MNPDLELAWACGFYDGEGNCFGSSTQFRISVGQVFLPNLERFINAVGSGKIYGPYHKGNKPIYVWASCGDEGIAVSRKLLPIIGREKEDQILRSFVRYVFRTVGHSGHMSSICSRGHSISVFGRYKDGDCNECRRMRRAGIDPTPKRPSPTAISLRLHGIREYVPPTMTRAREAVAWTFGKEESDYAPELQS